MAKLSKILFSLRLQVLAILFSCFFFFFSSFAFSQTLDTTVNSKNLLPNDTTEFKSLSKITDNLEVSNKKFEMKKSPLGAVLRSLAFPGWGQVYVESYWKAPLFAAGCGLLVYFIVDNNSKFQTYQKQFDELKLSNPNSSEIFILRSKKEFYRDNRDQSAFFLAAVYILAAIDSYVGAHLYDFNVDDNITLSINNHVYPSISLKIKLK